MTKTNTLVLIFESRRTVDDYLSNTKKRCSNNIQEFSEFSMMLSMKCSIPSIGGKVRVFKELTTSKLVLDDQNKSFYF